MASDKKNSRNADTYKRARNKTDPSQHYGGGIGQKQNRKQKGRQTGPENNSPQGNNQ
jgi:hypothetical protein